MSITLSQIANSNYFGTLLTRLNQALSIISSNTVTADASTNGSLTTGNSFVNGSFGTLNLATNNLSGGSIALPANLVVTTNASFMSGPYNLGGIYGNLTSGSTFLIQTNNMVVNNSTVIVGNLNFANTIFSNGNIGTNTSLSVTGFLNINTTAVLVGNATVNSSINAISHVMGNTVVNTSIIEVGANLIINSSAIMLGNSSVNASINSTAYSGAANNASYIGGLPAANVVSNAQLIANLTNYLTSASLAANVATMTANNSTNLGGQAAAYYANTTSFTGAFNGTNLNASGWANVVGQVNVGAGLVSTGFDNGGFGGQYRLINGGYGVILRNDGTSMYFMETASANATGTWSTLRPFSWTLATGAVIIDGTGVGTTIGGNLSTNGTMTFGNSTVNSSINSTFYSAIANNTSFVGSVSAANVVSNAQLTANIQYFVNTSQLTANLTSYQTTAGLVGNVATITSNNATNFAGQAQAFYANTSAPVFTTTMSVGSNVVVNTSTITVGKVLPITIGNGFVQSSVMQTRNISANITLANTDSGSVILVSGAANVYITVPSTMPANSRLIITQIGTGTPIIANAAGIILGSRTGNYGIITQYGSASVFMANSILCVVDGNI